MDFICLLVNLTEQSEVQVRRALDEASIGSFRYFSLADGSAAIDFLTLQIEQDNPPAPDLIVWEMMDSDFVQQRAIHALQKHPELSDLPFALLTSEAMLDQVREILQLRDLYCVEDLQRATEFVVFINQLLCDREPA